MDHAPIHGQTLDMNSVPPRSLTAVAVGPTVAGVVPLAVAEVASSADCAQIIVRFVGCSSFGTVMACWLAGMCYWDSSQLHLNTARGLSMLMPMASLISVDSVCDRTVTCAFWLAALRPDVSGVAVDAKLFHDSGHCLVHKYQIYRDPIPHPALRGRVVSKLINFVARAMAIAQLTHLHLTIPASGSVGEKVPEECFPPVLLPRGSVSTQRVLFASRVAVIDSMPESLGDQAMEGPEPTGSSDILIHRPTYQLFPGRDPMDESPLEFPSITVPPGFNRIVRSGDTLGPAKPPSVVDISPIFPGWYPLANPGGARDAPPILSPISPIACASPHVSEICRSLASPMLSDASDRDAGLLAELLSPSSFEPTQPRAESSVLPSSGAMDCPASHVPLGSVIPVPLWRLARGGASRKFRL